MFKKKPTIKSLAPIRSSDRRKLADQIIAMYGLQPEITTSSEAATVGGEAPEAPQDEATLKAQQDQQQQEAQTALTSLRNSILPENTQSGKLSTTVGPTSRPVSLTVYVGGSDARVLWVRDGNFNSSSPEKQPLLWPTLYTLWKNPHLIPLLHTHPPVVVKMQAGAELMIPGLAKAAGESFPENAKKGRVVAVGSTSKMGVPVAVGVCDMDICNLGEVGGMKGVAVRTLMWVGDELWSWSASGKKGEDPENIKSWNDMDVKELEQGVENLTVSAESKDSEPSAAAQETAESEEKTSIFDKNWDTRDIDKAFRDAFTYGVHHLKQNGSPPTFGVDFPIKQSFVMSGLIQPYLPIFTPKDQEALQMKKTSWKNMRKFVKSLDKDGVLLSKERDNEAIILDIDFDHASIANFQPYRLPKKTTNTSTNPSAAPTDPDADPSLNQTLTITMLYRPKDVLSPLFPSSGLKGYYTTSEFRTALNHYISTEDPPLPVPSNPRLLSLNPFLASLLDPSSQPADKQALSSGNLPRDSLLPRILKHASPFYTISSSTDPESTAQKPTAGQPPRLTITMSTRTGTKTVTVVSGLFQTFRIDPQRLSDALRKVCAGATSVERAPGSTDKKPIMDVMVQGPQRDAVLKELAKRGVKNEWVDVVDKTGKGKGRR